MNVELVYIRNKLRKNECDKNIEDLLYKIMGSLIQTNNPFFAICKQACSNALNDILEKKYETASYEINLIHNMPIELDDIQNWDERHFYIYELAVYFEHAEDVNRIKKLISLLADLTNKI